jgi:hypothetical protein
MPRTIPLAGVLIGAVFAIHVPTVAQDRAGKQDRAAARQQQRRPQDRSGQRDRRPDDRRPRSGRDADDNRRRDSAGSIRYSRPRAEPPQPAPAVPQRRTGNLRDGRQLSVRPLRAPSRYVRGHEVRRVVVPRGPEQRWARVRYPSWGSRVVKLPPRTREYVLRGNRYWVSRGVVYRSGPTGYVVARPPIGMRVAWLPVDYTVYQFDGAPYYYADSVWYRPIEGKRFDLDLGFRDFHLGIDIDLDDDDPRFEVVPPPVGGLVEVLPESYQTVEYERRTYYRADDVYYEPVYQSDRLMYMRVDIRF